MTLPKLKRVLCCAGALILAGTTSVRTEAGLPFFYHAAYSPLSYSAFYGFGGYTDCCGTYGASYGGYGLWGASYVSYYAPSYYTSYFPSYYTSYFPSYYTSYYPSYYTSYFPSYYTSTSYYAPIYTAAYDPCCVGYSACAVSCDPCAACCDPCGACGLASCCPCGFPSACCPTDCATGSQTSPSPQTEQIPPYSGGGDSPPSTFREDQDPNEPFRQPAPQQNSPPPFDGGRDRGGSGTGGGVFPDQGAGAEVEREAYRIEQREGAAPANAEPGAAEPNEADPQTTKEPPSDEGQPAEGRGTNGQSADEDETDVPPADIDAKLAAAVLPERDRVRYTVRFTAPRIARLEIPLERTPLRTGPQLAATR